MHLHHPTAASSRMPAWYDSGPAYDQMIAERRARRRTVMCVIAIFFAGMFAAEPYWESPEQLSASLFGSGMAMVMVSYGIAALFLGWSQSGRRLVNRGALAFSFLALVGQCRETDPQLAAMQLWADSLGTGQVSDVDPPPHGMEARLEWASRNARADNNAYTLALAADYGIEPKEWPAGWMSTEYLADARKYPEVREHFTRHRALIQELDTMQIPIAERHVNLRLLQAGFSSRFVGGMMDSVRIALADRSIELRRVNADHMAFVDRAMELHDLLVRVDTRAHLDSKAGIARFERDSELEQVSRLVEEVERLHRAVQSTKAAPP